MQNNKGIVRNLAMVTQIGLSIMTPIFLCIITGHYLDRYLGTKMIFIFMILGFASGGRNGYQLARHMIWMEDQEDEQSNILMDEESADESEFL